MADNASFLLLKREFERERDMFVVSLAFQHFSCSTPASLPQKHIAVIFCL
jgi:hypothetical protein